MAYSVQQIKFEFLSYIKELEAARPQWFVGVCGDAEQALFASRAVDRDQDIWLWKPTLSARAAESVHVFFQERFGLATAPCSQPGPDASCVFLYCAGPMVGDRTEKIAAC
ncbi:hypothetical protein [Stutzerimonas tarimensis]|uniref:Uncharacterized protein n=1 Tax=Stutzerimonas tarimensis TaxID=1507735 RepID=A0ABV7TBR3_9GAMM